MNRARMIKFQSFTIMLLAISLLSSCEFEDESLKLEQSNQKSDSFPAIVIHGGAGEIKPGFLSSDQEEEYRKKLKEALRSGYSILENGGSSLDAVETTLKILEDSPLFNAAIGSVLTHEGEVSMDASIMNGKDLNAGAISGVKHIKNPIALARLVMDSSRHVFLSGEGAELFAAKYEMDMIDNDYFKTPKRIDQLNKKLNKDSISLSDNELEIGDKYGTVGCVAIDLKGNIAAGTSTGGMVNKQWGRIGDSPIIGAGTFADNRSCGISATGHGEYFIRLSIARNISDLIIYKGMSLADASQEVIQNQLSELGGSGGIIAIDRNGQCHFEFNTPGMYRGMKTSTKEVISMYKN